MRPLTGWHVFAMFALGFGIIIAVNLTLAAKAVQTFPGLEVKNSYVASQGFDATRQAQEALDWDVSAILEGNLLKLSFRKDGMPVEPSIERTVFGRATNVASDQQPNFELINGIYSAQVEAGPGNWNLRIVARANDQTLFKQRVVVEVVQ